MHTPRYRNAPQPAPSALTGRVRWGLCGKLRRAQPDPLLFGAFFRASGEDQITEVFATVLAGAPPFAAQLAELAGLPRCERYEFATQVRTPGGVIDLEIRAYDGAGRATWLLWSEHKQHAPFSQQQLSRYSAALQDAADGLESRLVAITQWEPSPAVKKEADRL